MLVLKNFPAKGRQRWGWTKTLNSFTPFSTLFFHSPRNGITIPKTVTTDGLNTRKPSQHYSGKNRSKVERKREAFRSRMKPKYPRQLWAEMCWIKYTGCNLRTIWHVLSPVENDTLRRGDPTTGWQKRTIPKGHLVYTVLRSQIQQPQDKSRDSRRGSQKEAHKHQHFHHAMEENFLQEMPFNRHTA